MAAIALENPTSQLADTLLEHTDMDEMDNIAVDRWRSKLATELPAHVLTIFDKVDKQVRAKPSVTTELSNVASWHSRKGGLCVLSQARHNGNNTVKYIKK